jgi:hypothetical protein
MAAVTTATAQCGSTVCGPVDASSDEPSLSDSDHSVLDPMLESTHPGNRVFAINNGECSEVVEHTELVASV